MNVNPTDSANSSLSILVVDDEELNQRLMRLLLHRDGYQVECAYNGLEALEAVKSRKFDLILMDLQMPVMDGVESSRQIREWENGDGHTFIVALTASYLPEKGRELFEAGIDNYLAKPFDVEHLRHILQYGLERRKSGYDSERGNPETEPQEGVQVFDFQVGLQRVGGNANIYWELLSDFLDEFPTKLENLWSQYRNKDMDGLHRTAHNLKGVSANLGALQLSEHALRLEKQASQGYTESIEDLIKNISSAMRKLQNAATNYLSGREVKAAEIS